ncbi:SDR family NAD(P)-dependent oxidoreductase [Levilactobacillus tujiorum]|uniref:SDR family NAD(P)-dependent oxidoreductase n=1 Tax=Levilactobacillus tujiorum TaxID=2912243 RepID=A0ABX1L8U6_9LACO|nr:SDR family NAD(P)-dependent oxidoreductase [Levilactobacillus tujiorum]MCH5465549.1 SDR family NAD(P)-dependent oxidoreductase [Levilactobacillus tujiorum]NLR12940.1 SDR family NAD(P)-dependent oxidoreductase [Lactobacillus sp. HBUAS51387]NLR30771.1 SDR family NAD(P)-dependent oxidoreductase [Levilactobacillus tujiorum]
MTKTAVVLGAGSGFGLAIARAFSQAGVHPILVARNAQKLQTLTEQLHTEGLMADWIAADATNPDQTANMFQQVIRQFGSPQTLVYNVADTTLDDPLNTPITDIQQRFTTNVVGAIIAGRQFLDLTTPDLPRNLLFTGGGAALHPDHSTTTLSLTKAALRSYVLSLADAFHDTDTYVGLVTIQGIAGTSEAMRPANVAQVYVKATQQRDTAEILYPATPVNSPSEFNQLRKVVANPAQLHDFLSQHPTAANFLQTHPEFLSPNVPNKN